MQRSYRPRALRLNFYARVVATLLAILLAVPLGALRAQTRPTNPTDLPPALVGQRYDFTFTADGGTAPLTWGVVSGSLPDGLTLDSNRGMLSGTPTIAHSTPSIFTVEVTDSSTSERQKFRKQFALLVQAQGARPLTIGNSSSGGGVSRSSQADEPAPQPKEQARTSEGSSDCDVDVEANSDTLSIAVRNEYSANDVASAINLNQKKNLIKNANELIGKTLGTCNDNQWEKDDYVIIHLVKWPLQPPAGGEQKYEPESEKWYLYKRAGSRWEPQTVQGGERIYGHKRVGVLLVHLKARETWDIKYTVDVKEKTPGPIQNVLDLAAIIAGGVGISAITEPEIVDYWGGRLLILKDVPVEIKVQSDIAFVNQVGDEDKQTQQPKVYAKTYDNEGRYHWDVSVGIPVKSFKEVQYDTEGGQVRAKEVNRQNAYGFLNLFFNPRGVDTKGDEFYKTPHLVLGVPISGKPLDRPMVGLGFGFYNYGLKFNLFGGLVFNRVREPRTLAAGQAATGAQLESDLQTRRVTKFIFGFNIPVKQLKDALSKK
jgi:hypothetical protein